MVENTAPLDVAVSGGSMGGLFTGLALRGCDRDVEVDVFERSAGQLEHRGAGIVAQPVICDFLRDHDIIAPDEITTTTRTRQYLDREGRVERAYDEEMTFTGWDALYRALREAFPDEDYHTDRKTTGVETGGERERAGHEHGHGSRGGREASDSDDRGALLRFADGESVKTDLAVIAEGGQSGTREELLPGVSPEYAGYVAWRGVVGEEGVPPALRDRFDNAFVFYEGAEDLVLAYLIPGPDGSTEKGDRRLNWVWYDTADRGERRRLLTDSDGRTHDFSVPPGKLRADVDDELLAAVENRLPDQFADLVGATDDRFVQTIYDLSVPRMVFDRTCLLGDSAFAARPHTAAGTAKAAADGIALAGALDENGKIDAALAEWERERLDAGRRLVAQGREMGENYMA